MCAEISAEVTEQSQQQVRLQVCREPCTGCDGKCLGMLFSRSEPNSVEVSRLHIDSTSGQFTAGDKVRVLVRPKTLIALSSLVYLAPLILMLLSAVACEMMISQSDSAVAGSAALGLVAGLAMVKAALARLELKRSSDTLLIKPGNPKAQ